MGRSGEPDPRPASSAKTASPAAERERFKQAVLFADGGRCVVHPDPSGCDGPLQAHHCVSQQQLRHAGRPDLLWAWRNGLTVCEKAHRRHTLAVERLPLDVLPARCIDFARAYGFAWLLARYYPAAPA